MRQQGSLTDWNDGKGFGFITPATGGQRIFVHISSFPRDRRRPVVNDSVTYVASRDRKNRWRADKVRFQQVRSRAATPPAKRWRLAVVLGVGLFAFLAALGITGLVPWALLGGYALLSSVSFSMYGMDKAAAQKGRRRTAEVTLHLLGLAGGWPGALVAQRVFRHKTKKQPFQLVFWCTVLGNSAVLAWFLYADEAVWLRAVLG